MANGDIKKANEQFLRALIMLSRTADELTSLWAEHPMADFLGIEDYPNAFNETSFDDIAADIRKWKETQIELLTK